jgi:chromate transporter
VAVSGGVSLGALCLVFLKIGAVLYGSGYVLLAFLRSDLVERYHWLSDRQLLDAVAIGQFTPGPVFTTATFIGYVLAGWVGGVLATIAIFLPSFVFVALSQPLVPWIRRSAGAAAFLDGVNAAALGLMLAVTGQLARAAVVDAPTLALGVVALVLLLRFRVNSAWLVAGGAAIGLALHGRG